jgi:hypothetical protein
VTRDPSRCDYCREPFATRMGILHMLDKTGRLAEPMFNIHLSCSYELLEELKNRIQRLEANMQK